jgi:hypothetical protein
MDVEPMGSEYVRSMCHDIEDPTFDATAIATNARARVRPIHRPPRTPADRHPHCAWTVRIDEAYPAAVPTEGCLDLQAKRAASLRLDPVDRADDGLPDYSGPLLSDVDFGAFSRSALIRMADEIVLQMHLLALGFIRALEQRGTAAQVRSIVTKQLTGIAGLTAERLHRALDLPGGTAGALRVLALHPLLNPAAYVHVEVSGHGDTIAVAASPAHEDGGWLSFCGPEPYGSDRPLRAIVQAVDPELDVELHGTGDTGTDWMLRVVPGDGPAAELEEVAVTRFSTGAAFRFTPRSSLPITPIVG